MKKRLLTIVAMVLVMSLMLSSCMYNAIFNKSSQIPPVPQSSSEPEPSSAPVPTPSSEPVSSEPYSSEPKSSEPVMPVVPADTIRSDAYKNTEALLLKALNYVVGFAEYENAYFKFANPFTGKTAINHVTLDKYLLTTFNNKSPSLLLWCQTVVVNNGKEYPQQVMIIKMDYSKNIEIDESYVSSLSGGSEGTFICRIDEIQHRYGIVSQILTAGYYIRDGMLASKLYPNGFMESEAQVLYSFHTDYAKSVIETIFGESSDRESFQTILKFKFSDSIIEEGFITNTKQQSVSSNEMTLIYNEITKDKDNAKQLRWIDLTKKTLELGQEKLPLRNYSDDSILEMFDYVLNNKITEKYLKNCSKSDVECLIMMVYAHEGLKMSGDYFSSFFKYGGFSWYDSSKNTITDTDELYKNLNETLKSNIDVMNSYMSKVS